MASSNESSRPTGHEKNPESSFKKRKQRKTATFPMILHYMLSELEKDSLGHLMSWQPNGHSFIVRNPKQVEKTIIPLWFRPSKFSSFQRQLNLYGFNRITTGSDAGGYHHRLFVRGNASLAEQMGRSIIKSTHSRKLNYTTDSNVDVEALSDLRSEDWKSDDTIDHDTSKSSPLPNFTRVTEAADPYSPLSTFMQSVQELHIDHLKDTHCQSETSLVPCHIVEYPTLAPQYTLKEAITFKPITRPSSQPYSFGDQQVAAGRMIQRQEQVQSELSPMQAYKMAYLRAEVMKTLLAATTVVPAAGDRQDFERLLFTLE